MAHFVLVHGACHGGWCWEAVVPLLSAAGHSVACPDMPGRGDDPRDPAGLTLADQARAVLDAARAAPSQEKAGGGEVILVGHSAGGFAIAAAAEAAPELARRLVFVAALLPRDGHRLTEVMRNLSARHPDMRFIPARHGAAYVFDTARAGPVLYNGTTDAQAEAALARICAEPTAPHGEAIALGPAFDRVAKSYVLCTADHVIPAADQQRMAAAAGAAITRIDTGHSPFLSTPGALADHLLSLTGSA
ncbi:alpha/beta fold hydrolase [Pseudooceanicola aestuarii]|uniref:alpha/beta fold hydrolase n=1 Tax=Pseudooceanicola aestuarii TaxID=2697319 RepID=UPI0013D10DDD|nr:alpha/beta fold hydrolase [Pseudooceanicola aestuarii]